MLCFNQIFVSGDRSAIPDEERNEVERNKSSILDGESSSSSSSDFVPFQNIKSILSTENSTASSQRSLSGEDSNSKGSVTEEAKKRKEVDLHCDEELELADLVASGNSQTFRHVIIDNRSWPAGRDRRRRRRRIVLLTPVLPQVTSCKSRRFKSIATAEGNSSRATSTATRWTASNTF
eukprot:750462-Hanusia_phi.AAC.6